jgi:hypothetical protein
VRLSSIITGSVKYLKHKNSVYVVYEIRWRREAFKDLLKHVHEYSLRQTYYQCVRPVFETSDTWCRYNK